MILECISEKVQHVSTCRLAFDISRRVQLGAMRRPADMLLVPPSDKAREAPAPNTDLTNLAQGHFGSRPFCFALAGLLWWLMGVLAMASHQGDALFYSGVIEFHMFAYQPTSRVHLKREICNLRNEPKNTQFY